MRKINENAYPVVLSFSRFVRDQQTTKRQFMAQKFEELYISRSSGEHKEEEDSSPSETISSGLKKKNVEYKTSDSWRNSRNQNRNKISRYFSPESRYEQLNILCKPFSFSFFLT